MSELPVVETRPSSAFRVVDGILTAVLSVAAVLTAFVMLSLFLMPWAGGRSNAFTVILGNVGAAAAIAGLVVGWVRFARRRSAFWVVIAGILVALVIAVLNVAVIMPTIPPLLPPG